MSTSSTRLKAIRLALPALILSILAQPLHAETPQRIVSIGGAVTEVLYEIGIQDRIVAVDTTSLYPAEALQTKPNVGYLRALSAEGVLAMSPDLIIMEKDAGPPETVALLDQARIPVVHVQAGYEAETLPEKILEVAAAVGQEEKGKRIADRVATEFARLKKDLEAVEHPKRVLFILSLIDGRPMAAGANTAANAIIQLAGAENVFADAQGYKTISPEAAAALQPDAILMITRSGAPEEGEDILSRPAFAETPAAKSGAFIKMDGLYLLGFGPRTPEAARELATKLYPDLHFAEPR